MQHHGGIDLLRHGRGEFIVEYHIVNTGARGQVGLDLALRHSAAFEHRTGAIPGLPYGERGLAENVYLNVAVGLRRLPIGAVLPATCIRHYREVSDDSHVGGRFRQVNL